IEPVAGAPLALRVTEDASDDDLLEIAERPGMWRVHRAETTDRPREIALVRFAPGEVDRRPPARVLRGTESPARGEHRREVVRVVVVAHAGGARPAHRVG